MTLQGAHSHWAKLTEEQVRSIRKEYDLSIATGESTHAVTKRLSAAYGMAPMTIYYIGIRKTWKSLGEDHETTDGPKQS
jgi:hypothetical protein